MDRTGTVRVQQRGFGFVDLDEPFEVPGRTRAVDRLFVAPPRLADLLDGDRVACEAIESEKGNGYDADGIVLLSRTRRLVAGTIGPDRRGERTVVRPDPTLSNREWTPGTGMLPSQPRTGDGVVATISSDAAAGEGRRLDDIVVGPFAAQSWRWLRAVALVREAGAIDRSDALLAADADAALAVDLATDPSAARPPVTDAPDEDDDGPGDALDHLRADHTAQPVATIDGPGTRDLDDAVVAERLDDGSIRVFVHIADAAAAVVAGTPLDRRALVRATTTYLPSGALPMLPHELSEGSLSLRPGRRRRALTFACTITPTGEITAPEVGLSWVRPAARLTYAQVELRLDDGWNPGSTDPDDGHEVTPLAEVAGAVWRSIDACAEAATRIAEARLASGAQHTDLFAEPEARPIVDDGRITLRREVVTPQAQQLVERLMVAANEVAAGWLAERGAPALYRVQAAPDPERLDRFAAMLATVGIPVDIEALADPSVTDRLIDAAVEAGIERIALGGLVASGLNRASYQTDPGDGHASLGVLRYVHATSPIRRYADLVIHRSIRAELAGESHPLSGPDLERAARWIDGRAGAASRAERLEGRLLWADILDRTISVGRPYTASALVGSITPNGLRVRVDRFDLVGTIPAEALGVERRLEVSENGLEANTPAGLVHVGDRMRVRIAEVDRGTGFLTFEPA